MASEEKKLTVDVIARIDKLEKGMAKAAANVNRQSSVMEGRIKKFGGSIETSIGGTVAKVNGLLGKIGLGGLAAGGIAGLVSGFGSVARSVAEIGDEARRAGVSFKAFQELRYVAERSRIGVDALTDGLKELNLRADEFVVTGKGSAAEAFNRLGYDAETLATKLKNPSELFLEIIGRLGDLDKAAQIRIADELFGGTGGEKFVQLIEQGEAGIRETIKAANDLGIVLDDSVIDRAAEIDRQFNAITTTVGTNLKGAIVSAADSLVDFIDRLRSVESQGKDTLQERMIELGLKRLEIETKILETRNGGLGSRNKNRAIQVYEQQLRDLAAEEAGVVDALSKRNAAVPSVTKPTDREWKPIPPADPAGDKKRAKEITEIEREAAARRELIADLDFEYAMIGKTEAQREKMIALRQAGAAATTEERLAIATKIDAIHAENAALEASKARMDELASAGSEFTKSIVDGFRNGEKASVALGKAFQNLMAKFADKAIDGAFCGPCNAIKFGAKN